MEVRLLGEVGVVIDGVSRTVPGIRQRTLLALLAVDAGVAVGSERLSEELFGGARNAGTSALHVCVSRLRSALGEHRDLVATAPSGYRFEVEPSQVDAHQLHRAVALARRGGIDIEALCRALDRWVGTPFTGASAVRTLEFEEQRLRDLRKEGTLHLIAAMREAGRIDEALARAETALRWGGEDDDLAGVHAQLLETVQRPIVGVDPPLRTAPRRGVPGPGADMEHRPTRWPAPLERAGAGLLVGDVHQAVARSAARPRSPQLTVVVGEAGRGKTATAASWATGWRRKGRQIRYLSWEDSALSRSALEPRLAGLLDADDDDQEMSPHHGKSAPQVAIVLDDLHRLADETAGHVEALVERASTRQIPVVLLGRPGPADSTWMRLVAWASDVPGSKAFELPLLSSEEVRALVLSALRDKPTGGRFDDRGLPARIWEATTGNAMAVAAVAAYLENLDSDAELGEQFPLALGDLVSRHLQQLSTPMQATLCALVVFDADRVAPVDVQSVLATSPGHVIAQLGALAARDLVAIDADGWVRAPHPLYRRALLDHLDPLARRMLHLQAADVLEASARPLLAARQRCDAVPLTDGVVAATGAVTALRGASSDLVPGIGLAVAEAARRAVGSPTGSTRALRAEIDLWCAAHLEALGRRDEAELVQGRAFTAVLSTDRADLIAAAAIGSDVLGRRSRQSGAWDRLEVADARLRELDAVGESQIVSAALLAERFSAGDGVPAALVERFAALVARGGPLGDDEVALARTFAAWSAPVGEVPEPPLHALSPAALALTSRGRLRSPAPHQLRLALALRRGDLKAAEVALAALDGAVHRSDTPRGRWFALAQRSALALARGDATGSAATMAEAATLGRRFELVDAPMVEVAHGIAVAMATGQEAELAEQAGDFVNHMADAEGLPVVRAGAAFLLAQASPLEAAVVLSDYLDELTRRRHLPFRVLGLALAAQTAASLDDAQAARRIVTALEPYRGEIVCLGVGVVCFGPVDRILGLAAATAGRHDLAAEVSETALEWATHWNAGVWVDRCQAAVDQVAGMQVN